MEELVDLWGREGWNKNPKCAAIRLGRAVTLAPYEGVIVYCDIHPISRGAGVWGLSREAWGAYAYAAQCLSGVEFWQDLKTRQTLHHGVLIAIGIAIFNHPTTTVVPALGE